MPRAQDPAFWETRNNSGFSFMIQIWWPWAHGGTYNLMTVYIPDHSPANAWGAKMFGVVTGAFILVELYYLLKGVVQILGFGVMLSLINCVANVGLVKRLCERHHRPTWSFDGARAMCWLHYHNYDYHHHTMGLGPKVRAKYGVTRCICKCKSCEDRKRVVHVDHNRPGGLGFKVCINSYLNQGVVVERVETAARGQAKPRVVGGMFVMAINGKNVRKRTLLPPGTWCPTSAWPFVRVALCARGALCARRFVRTAHVRVARVHQRACAAPSACVHQAWL